MFKTTDTGLLIHETSRVKKHTDKLGPRPGHQTLSGRERG
jgi:hypothetical protein